MIYCKSESNNFFSKIGGRLYCFYFVVSEINDIKLGFIFFDFISYFYFIF